MWTLDSAVFQSWLLHSTHGSLRLWETLTVSLRVLSDVPCVYLLLTVQLLSNVHPWSHGVLLPGAVCHHLVLRALLQYIAHINAALVLRKGQTEGIALVLIWSVYYNLQCIFKVNVF